MNTTPVTLRYDIGGGGVVDMNTTPVTLRYDIGVGTCAARDCTNTVTQPIVGRPARYCSTACRVREHRRRRAAADAPITVEIDMGSASSRGRPPDRAWLVRVRRADRAVIVAIGLRRYAADRLAAQLTELLTNTPQPEGGTID
jgi:hypothetical protein